MPLKVRSGRKHPRNVSDVTFLQLGPNRSRFGSSKTHQPPLCHMRQTNFASAPTTPACSSAIMAC
jgi:hypothetical protein